MTVKNILLLADHESGLEQLRVCLSGPDYRVATALLRDVDIGSYAGYEQSGIAILNVDSLTRMHHSLLLSIQQNAPQPVVVFAGQSDEEAIVLAVNAGANSIVIGNIECHRLPGIIKIASARFQRCMALRAELSSAQQKLKDRASIDRAKGILHSRKGMDEERAYRFLRKMAMDHNLRIGELAARFVELEAMLE